MISSQDSQRKPTRRLVIIGGGPGGYEAALHARTLGADVTIIEDKGMGGSAVLTDVVPSKTLIASADTMNRFTEAQDLGVHVAGATSDDDSLNGLEVDLEVVNTRLLRLAVTQSRDIRRGLERDGVHIVEGRGSMLDDRTVHVVAADGMEYDLEADAVLIAVGAHPRELGSARPDGERIFNWTQLYSMTDLPEHLVVVGSGVTGAEFASAYNGLGAKVTLVSSRDQVLPGEDADAAEVLENVFERRGLNVMSRSRAASVERVDDGVVVTLNDGRKISASHCLMAVGGVPNTEGLGLENTGVHVSESGHIEVDGVSRTTVPSIYAAGDCTGKLPLASVAAMQGRIAVSHFLGDAVRPLRLSTVASNIFTSPEIASVGITEGDVRSGRYAADVHKIPLPNNPRAKMMAVDDGFVKVIARKGPGTVLGGVVVGPRASELIFALSVAVSKGLTVDDLAETFTVYPSLSGTISEAARRLHQRL
ncbi:UNVERIFIED_CONTAM: NAD(P)H-quinone dehydrogenase [Kocuria sp. CPCC 205295]|uniref:NAD(P)H-quinone dehydrogenase n=1 Tax=Kocuria TaxID=57493 RepID=UPI000ADF7510|nr:MULTISPECIES: NAD(P)H-quinone dehydrogenase [Kocuria]MBM7822346.1 dihydrolipoamide dehydrogenase [Kocuria palustris]MCM3331336.1 NAD(P)H-quinone dehydrogenase [Kocuria palustris]MCT1590272.1 NAD(P)H-quinone dehydrogenase [Kocuria palustris]MCY1684099.1 NAD(P)H-quinone dehydrogenase [Kocuria sp. SL71]MDH5151776.1 NAD(P)H-quinone dehydrogenase [Kocuria palustris]